VVNPHRPTNLIAKTLLRASYGLLGGRQKGHLHPWQRSKAVIQCWCGTGWEADDRKGLGCHCLRVVAFAVEAPQTSFQKTKKI